MRVRRVAGLQRLRVVAVAAASKHSAALTSGGELYTFGDNQAGQLGIGTPDSCCNPSPRLVDSLKVLGCAASCRSPAAAAVGCKALSHSAPALLRICELCDAASRAIVVQGKTLVAVSAAKRHTVVLTADGEVLTWGHQVVTPRRVNLAGTRDVWRCANPATAPATPGAASSSAAPAGGVTPASAAGASVAGGALAAAAGPAAAAALGEPLRFHRGHAEVVRPVAVAVAAGFTHTTVVTRTGCTLVWWSADPALRVQEVQGPLAGAHLPRALALPVLPLPLLFGER